LHLLGEAKVERDNLHSHRVYAILGGVSFFCQLF
jgi:hypothetical protein